MLIFVTQYFGTHPICSHSLTVFTQKFTNKEALIQMKCIKAFRFEPELKRVLFRERAHRESRLSDVALWRY